MKTLTCRDLGGPCDTAFTGNSFEEIGKKCRRHVIEQIQMGDEAHVSAADEMKTATPEQQRAFMAEFRKRFDDAASE